MFECHDVLYYLCGKLILMDFSFLSKYFQPKKKHQNNPNVQGQINSK